MITTEEIGYVSFMTRSSIKHVKVEKLFDLLDENGGVITESTVNGLWCIFDTKEGKERFEAEFGV